MDATFASGRHNHSGQRQEGRKHYLLESTDKMMSKPLVILTLLSVALLAEGKPQFSLHFPQLPQQQGFAPQHSPAEHFFPEPTSHQGQPQNHQFSQPQGRPQNHQFSQPQGRPQDHQFSQPQGRPQNHQFSQPQGRPQNHQFSQPQGVQQNPQFSQPQGFNRRPTFEEYSQQQPSLPHGAPTQPKIERVNNEKFAMVFTNNHGTYDAALSVCQSLPEQGSTLFIVESAEDSNWLGRRINYEKDWVTGSSKFWVGLNSNGLGNQLYWLTNSPYVKYAEVVQESGYDDPEKIYAWAVPDGGVNLKYEFLTPTDEAEAFICQF